MGGGHDLRLAVPPERGGRAGAGGNLPRGERGKLAQRPRARLARDAQQVSGLASEVRVGHRHLQPRAGTRQASIEPPSLCWSFPSILPPGWMWGTGPQQAAGQHTSPLPAAPGQEGPPPATPAAGGPGIAAARRAARLPACLLPPPGGDVWGGAAGEHQQLRVYDAGTPSRPYGVNI